MTRRVLREQGDSEALMLRKWQTIVVALTIAPLQLEVVLELVGKLVLNGLRFGFGAGESDQPIISVANVPKPAEVGIKRVAGWDGLCLFVVGARAG
jgi:hypothetical protein